MTGYATAQTAGKSATEMASLEQKLNLATLDEREQISVVAVESLATESGSSEWDSDDEGSAVFSPGESSASSLSPFSSPDDSDDEEFDWGSKRGNIDSCGLEDDAVRRLHPAFDRLRIGIPTAHIYGSKDPYYRQSLGLAGLCDPQWASTYEHPEGHIVPRDKGVNVKIAATIERTLKMVDAFSR